MILSVFHESWPQRLLWPEVWKADFPLAQTLATREEAFPGPIALKPRELLADAGIEPTGPNLSIGDQTLQWLWDEGFFRSSSGPVLSGIGKDAQSIHLRATLTAKGLDALNIQIEIGGKRERAGDVLREQLAEGGKEARRAAISEMIGRIIGAAARGMIGG